MHLSLFQTVSHADRVQGRMHRCFLQSAASTGWIRSPSKTRPKVLDISSLEFYPLLHSSIYPPIAVHVSHNGCRRFKTKPSTANKLYICQQTDLLSLSTNIICCCQQTVQLPPVPKPIQLKQTISPKTAITRPKNVSKELYTNYVFCVVFCVLCITVLIVPTIKCNFFQQNLFIFHKNIRIYFV